MSSGRIEDLFRIPGSPKVARISAILATIAAGNDHKAEAVDLKFDSGPITSDNLIGWGPDSLDPLQEFRFLTTSNRYFRFNRISYTNLRYLRFTAYTLNPATFRMFTNVQSRGMNRGLQLFALGQRWSSVGFGTDYRGTIGILKAAGPVGEVSPERNVYFFFRFFDDTTDYNGWINADILVEGQAGTGSNYVRINRYVWQSTALGNLAAGMITAVPEPSTLVTSGIAALAGGAAALRRWRKERKLKTEAA